MKVLDGTGNGYYAKVDSENRVHTYSTSEPEDKHINRVGKVWSVISNTTPVGANDYIFYFKNDGTEEIGITDIRASAGAASKLYIRSVSGTPTYTASSDLTPIARNLGSSKTLTATIKEDTNITNLTDEGHLFVIPCPVADTLYHLRTSSNIIIPQGKAIAMYTTGTSAVEVTWSFVGLGS